MFKNLSVIYVKRKRSHWATVMHKEKRKLTFFVLFQSDNQDTKNVHVCVAKTLLLLDDEEKMSESDVFLNNASQLGSGSAAFLLWQKQYQDCVVSHDQTFCVLRLLWIINVWIAQRIFKGYYIDRIDIIFYVCDFLSRVNLNFFFFAGYRQSTKSSEYTTVTWDSQNE